MQKILERLVATLQENTEAVFCAIVRNHGSVPGKRARCRRSCRRKFSASSGARRFSSCSTAWRCSSSQWSTPEEIALSIVAELVQVRAGKGE